MDLTSLLRREPARSQIAEQLGHLPAFATEDVLPHDIAELMARLNRSEDGRCGSGAGSRRKP